MALEISAEERFFTLLNQLKHIPPCSSRQEARDMLLLLWMRICEGAGARRELLNRMRQRTLCAEHGWKNLDKSPCHLDSDTLPGIRIYLHSNGTIVIQRQGGAQDSEILHSRDRKSTRLNSSHLVISYAVFCLKKKKTRNTLITSHNRQL